LLQPEKRFPLRLLNNPLSAADGAATMGKQIPKAAGLAIRAVTTPLVIWDARRTSDARDATAMRTHNTVDYLRRALRRIV